MVTVDDENNLNNFEELISTDPDIDVEKYSWDKVKDALERGVLRATNISVKKVILRAFREGNLVEINGYIDKHTMLPQKFTLASDRKVRIVPYGSAARGGAYIATGVVIMPPSYVNVGAYVDEGTMIDSHVLVGSCAQIGKRVHLSAGVQIGGVLEPIGNRPVIIEDDVFIGAGSVIVEGILVKRRAVIAPGVILSKGLRIYDLVNEVVLERGAAVPEGAVVVPGVRAISNEKSWATQNGLYLQTPIIVKYRDQKSDASLTLEDALR
ncbi:MAG: 2,3,4,5-tetrahydropyridine-2,6-dicarboxylate N-succinyltransferase [Oligoflexia bacterium]|nr:2,3,4,5-tetrahydropyridine-2,6-dicarboxylate N-succinyltransferase [Oligoflexia bacterium]